MIYLYVILYFVIGYVLTAYVGTENDDIHEHAHICILLWPLWILASFFVLVDDLFILPYRGLRKYFLKRRDSE